MRFGSTLHRRRVPAWTESYFDYTRLKVLVDTEPPLEDLKEAIHSEINIILPLDEHWGVKIGSAEPPEYRGVSRPELEDLKISLLEIADNIAECQHYIRVNHEGVSRILAKAAVKYTTDAVSNIHVLPRLARHGKSSPHGPWLPQLNATLQHVREALNDNETDRPTRSCLREDDASGLEDALNHRYPDASDARESALAQLVQFATVHGSSGCQRKLLASLRSSSGEEPIPQHHDYLHKIIQRLRRADPPLDSSSAATTFHQVLELLHPSQLHLVQSQDILGRSPLHYPVLLSLDGVCREIISVVRDPSWENSLDKLRISPDVFRLTPMDYAIRKGHTAVVELLITEYKTLAHADKSQLVEKLDILATAIASESTEIARQLIKKGWGTRFVGRSGKTVLHIAAEQGLSKLVKDIVAVGVDVDAQESVRGWTALATASVQGNSEVVEALLQSGADAEIPDRRKWLAKDHAAHRGHMKVANAIKTEGSSELQSKPGRQLGATNIIPKRSPSDSVVFVHLGTLDLYRKVNPVDLAPYKKRISPIQIPYTSLDLSISLAGDSGQKEHTVSLPVMSENSDWPWCITTSDPDNAAIIFKIVRLPEETLIGTGVALVGSLAASLGRKRDTLIRDYSVPLVSDKFGHVGTIVFTVVVARPYNGTHPPPKDVQSLALAPSSTLGGHRGNGQNDNSGCLQIGENTIKSFLTAMELDVQLTKDDVPVIYHDFLVAEKGSDAPMHILTYGQFMAISDAQSASTWQEVSSKRLPWDERQRPQVVPKVRRKSLCAPLDSTTDALVGQMKRTLNYPGYKPNLRNHSIHEPFITLVELFRGLPEDIPLDIKLKYPMLYEAADFQMDNYVTEINLFLDTILSVTYVHAGRRRIIFTSFSPEICMVLAVKQQSYPMLFLNDSSNWPTGDMRAISLQMAARLVYRFGRSTVAWSINDNSGA
ncbi:hypothetical protein ACJZ2D_009923 [Fusarium nematophilum]